MLNEINTQFESTNAQNKLPFIQRKPRKGKCVHVLPNISWLKKGCYFLKKKNTNSLSNKILKLFSKLKKKEKVFFCILCYSYYILSAFWEFHFTILTLTHFGEMVRKSYHYRDEEHIPIWRKISLLGFYTFYMSCSDITMNK